MKICLFTYGEFRTFQVNLENNLNTLKYTIFDGNEVDVFIVSQRSGNYSPDNETTIKLIFENFNCNVRFIKYWDDLQPYHKTEQINHYTYNSKCIHKNGKHPFTANLWYRRYITNTLVNEYMEQHNIHYDLHMFIRLFDTTIKCNLSQDIISSTILSCPENKVFMSIDTIFIGKKDTINTIFLFGKEFPL